MKNRKLFWLICFLLSAISGSLGGILGVIVVRALL
jgi:hypothetical protein|nr:MAG TPA: NICKEL-COBALT-CADMIUM RESISTANCE PROTEIN NCCX BINDING PROTEIN, MEMBRANE PROTEIN [Caudoviricetes sp.]